MYHIVIPCTFLYLVVLLVPNVIFSQITTQHEKMIKFSGNSKKIGKTG